MSGPLFQNSLYIGNTCNAILYGVELMLYAKTMHIYITTDSKRQRSRRFYMFFSTALLILITIYMATQSLFGEEMWIVHADYPGGAAAYQADYASIWYQTLGTTASIILELMSDGLLIYRCFIVWQDWRIVILPCILWLATLAFGFLVLYISGGPNGDFFLGFAATIGVTYAATAIGMNVLVTCLICARIVYHARFTQQRLGSAIARQYFGVAAIIIESALPYALCGIAFVVSYGLNSEISVLFLSFYTMFTCLSPQMLILRVTSGRAWNADTVTRPAVSTVWFNNSPAAVTTIGVTSELMSENDGIHLHDMRKTSSSQDVELAYKVGY